jgi:hypothetical protein
MAFITPLDSGLPNPINTFFVLTKLPYQDRVHGVKKVLR